MLPVANGKRPASALSSVYALQAKAGIRVTRQGDSLKSHLLNEVRLIVKGQQSIS